MVQPLNEATLLPLLEGMRHVVVLEEHFVESGLGSRLLQVHARTGPSWELHIRGIPDHYIHAVKNQKSLRSEFGICGETLSRFVADLLG